MSRFTPGPYIIDRFNRNRLDRDLVIYSVNGQLVCTVRESGSEEERAQARADARLLSHSTELIAALKRLAGAAGGFTSDSLEAALDEACDVITRAEEAEEYPMARNQLPRKD